MFKDGYFEGEYATLFRTAKVRAVMADGRIFARTESGTPVSGSYAFDTLRNTFQYIATAQLPPFFTAVTGLQTGGSGRAVTYKGEATLMNGQIRFTVDFAGRSLDVVLRRLGEPALGDDLRAA